jgi:hypothetical protein
MAARYCRVNLSDRRRRVARPHSGCEEWEGPSNGLALWIVDSNRSGAWEPAYRQFGLATDTPVVGNWNNRSRKRIGVFRGGRRTSGSFRLRPAKQNNCGLRISSLSATQTSAATPIARTPRQKNLWVIRRSEWQREGR